MLKMQLDKYGVKYKITNVFDEIIEQGFTSLPVVKLEDGKLLKYDDIMPVIMKGELQ